MDLRDRCVMSGHSGSLRKLQARRIYDPVGPHVQTLSEIYDPIGCEYKVQTQGDQFARNFIGGVDSAHGADFLSFAYIFT